MQSEINPEDFIKNKMTAETDTTRKWNERF
jgi:hypothetical protein